MSYRINWQTIYEDFELYFPSLSKGTVDYYQSGRMEITVYLSDGSRVVYDYGTKSIRTIVKKNDYKTDEPYPTEDKWLEEFSINLRHKMKERGINQTMLSNSINVSQMLVSKYVNGKTMPSSYNLLKISRVLECSVSELIDLDI